MNQDVTKDDALQFVVFTALTDGVKKSTYERYEQICKRISEDLSMRLDNIKGEGFLKHRLLLSVALASEVSKRSKFQVNKLEDLGRDVEIVLNQMKEFSSSVPLPGESEPELLVTQQLEIELTRKQQAYLRLAKLCSERSLPLWSTVKRLAHLWPIVYLNAKTKQADFDLAAELLEIAEIVRKPSTKENDRRRVDKHLTEEQVEGDVRKDPNDLKKSFALAKKDDHKTLELMEQYLDNLIPYRVAKKQS